MQLQQSNDAECRTPLEPWLETSVEKEATKSNIGMELGTWLNSTSQQWLALKPEGRSKHEDAGHFSRERCTSAELAEQLETYMEELDEFLDCHGAEHPCIIVASLRRLTSVVGSRAKVVLAVIAESKVLLAAAFLRIVASTRGSAGTFDML